MQADQAAATTRVNARWLTECLQGIFKARGMAPDDAWLVADCLTQADMRGIHSHGSSRISIYAERLERGLVNPTPAIQVTQTAPGTLIVDGDNGMGAVVGHHAAKAVTVRAKETGIAAVSVYNSNHFGIAAVYAEAIVHAGCFALVCSNAPPTMAPYGGAEPVFGTNPIALGVPAPNHGSLVTDMATSLVARGKIIRASYERKAIPEDWALDSSGQRTTDPEKALNGVVLPFAGPKGSAIALFVDILAGVLSGANYGKHTPDLYRNLKDPSNIGHFMLAIDISRFQAINTFYERLEDCLGMINGCRPVDGQEPVKLPGQIEAQNKADAIAKGIELPADVIETLHQECTKVGLSFVPATS
ncbi:MAG: Ldh family oxidoreductase [Burkholderiaceae bacterium]|nr:Ldh family oxidoreductase [Burkholderiaceae bacterium]